MDYELRIVVEKVAVHSQEVIKRDTLTSYALQRPTSILELGLRHAEQISLLEKVQNILLKHTFPPHFATRRTISDGYCILALLCSHYKIGLY